MDGGRNYTQVVKHKSSVLNPHPVHTAAQLGTSTPGGPDVTQGLRRRSEGSKRED